MKERLFVTPEYTTAKEIKQIRKELHLTQKEFAEFVNCSKPTVERWERSEEVIRGPIVPFLKMLQKYPEYEEEVKVPEKVWPLRIWYMYEQDVCTLIDVNVKSLFGAIRNFNHLIHFLMALSDDLLDIRRSLCLLSNGIHHVINTLGNISHRLVYRFCTTCNAVHAFINALCRFFNIGGNRENFFADSLLFTS